ncbi:5'-nucleotidase C-terminal domain-containing protein [Flavobacterium sp.]|uniref:5'-nucleotidase C-terminal domain-containing protein n=1 Tax=Flavobacterium sp. TaxID=239 RepID=UPI003B9930FA
MVNLGKYPFLRYSLITILTLLIVVGCKSNHSVTAISGKEIKLVDSLPNAQQVTDFILPYKKNLDQKLDTLLCYNPVALDKSSGKWQTNIGNWLAQSCYEICNPICERNFNTKIDLVLFNHGGIRSNLPKGDVTLRNAFKIMPFENTAVVETLDAAQILEICQYMIVEEKPHPLYGLSFTIDEKGQAIDIKIQGKPLDNSKTYIVLTSDYLANGGDKMTFFQKSKKRLDLQLKLRDAIIQSFKKNKTVQFSNEVLITDKRS